MSLRPFVIALDPSDLDSLNEVVRREKVLETQWLRNAREEAGLSLLRGTAASKVRLAIRTERARLRASGLHTPTRDLLLAREVRIELRARKMHGPQKPIPEGHAGVPGRPVGASPRHYGRHEYDPGFTARMAVRLPAELGEQLVRAVYWKTMPIVTALREWQDVWGDGPEVLLRDAQRSGADGVLAAFAAALAPRPDADELLRKANLQDQIVTTGDIIRSAVERAVEHAVT